MGEWSKHIGYQEGQPRITGKPPTGLLTKFVKTLVLSEIKRRSRSPRSLSAKDARITGRNKNSIRGRTKWLWTMDVTGSMQGRQRITRNTLEGKQPPEGTRALSRKGTHRTGGKRVGPQHRSMMKGSTPSFDALWTGRRGLMRAVRRGG